MGAANHTQVIPHSKAQFDRGLAAHARMLRAEKYGSDICDADTFERDTKRLACGEPLDYVISWAPFLGVRIDLSLKPFIPRTETEYWTRLAIEKIRERGMADVDILDMCAGSGCIGLAVLAACPESRVTFVDINPSFLKQIEISARANGIFRQRFTIIRSDMFDAVREKFDFILANPPYVGMNDQIDEAVKSFEPREAWDGGDDGLSLIRRFLREAPKFLKPCGEIWMEFASTQMREIKKILRAVSRVRNSFVCLQDTPPLCGGEEWSDKQMHPAPVFLICSFFDGRCLFETSSNGMGCEWKTGAGSNRRYRTSSLVRSSSFISSRSIQSAALDCRTLRLGIRF